jgi:hypothetical protein
VKPLRILISSDYHGNAVAFQKIATEAQKLGANCLIVCGDITNFGSAKQAKNLLSIFENMDIPVLFVPGNCDLPSVLEVETENCFNLHGKCVKLDNFNFVGVGGSPIGPLHTPLEFSEDEIDDLLNFALSKCPKNDKLILISHTPPLDTKLDLAFNGEHIGSESVKLFIEEKKPIAVFCGHVHEARGVDRMNGTVIVNPGSARHGFYALVEIIDGEVIVKLCRLK